MARTAHDATPRFVFACGSCGAKLRVPAALQGRKIRCRGCESAARVPKIAFVKAPPRGRWLYRGGVLAMILGLCIALSGFFLFRGRSEQAVFELLTRLVIGGVLAFAGVRVILRTEAAEALGVS